MRNLEIKEFKPSVLRNATLICNGSSYMRTFNLNNGLILKEIKERESEHLSQYLFYDDFIDCLTKKLKLSKYIESEHIIMPKTVYVKKDRVVGYTLPYIKMDNLDTIIRSSTSLEEITNVFIELSRAIKKENQRGIIFPDLGNATNTFYDSKEKKIRFIDFDGLQIGDCESFNVSLLMSAYDNPTFEKSKYFDKSTTLFTSNFDKASLLALYIYYTTNTNITKFNIKDFRVQDNEYVLKKEALEEYLSRLGLEGSAIEEELFCIYNDKKNNNYIETSIKRLIKTHSLDYSSHTFRKK